MARQPDHAMEPDIARQPAAFAANEITKRYGAVDALAGVILAVAPGECMALVGESGSGKTTLLRMFNRMVEPDGGSVRVDGTDVRGLDPVRLRRGIGYVPQEGGLLPHWRVLRNAALVPWLEGRDDAESAARAALELVGLSADTFANRWPGELSGGQRQRVAIARALAGQPRHLLLDEPFGALDAITRADLRDAFVRLRSELTITTLLVTHDLAEAALLGDRIAVLRAGRVEQVGVPEEVFTRPATEYIDRLVDRARVRVP
jgi:osmoprotectant transport system ATP-binding protein